MALVFVDTNDALFGNAAVQVEGRGERDRHRRRLAGCCVRASVFWRGELFFMADAGLLFASSPVKISDEGGGF